MCQESSWDERICSPLQIFSSIKHMGPWPGGPRWHPGAGKGCVPETPVLAAPRPLHILGCLYRAVSAAKRGAEKISVRCGASLSRSCPRALLAACPNLSATTATRYWISVDLPTLYKLQAWDAFMAGVGIEVNRRRADLKLPLYRNLGTKRKFRNKKINCPS